MAGGEFDLIRDYFRARGSKRKDVVLGVGDDAAILQPTPNYELVITTDTMVDGVHFDANMPARALGHKLAAVNLSDLAAMGAEPLWLSLALTLPRVDEDWLAEFSAGLHDIATYYDCSLIGGDTTRGPMTLTITAHGQVPAGTALRRDTAKPGDWIYVSGQLGDAGLALAAQQGKLTLNDVDLARVTKRLNYPAPRVALGQALRGIASSAVDISDGLLADLSHILERSNVGARLDLAELPLSLALTENLELAQALELALTSGDDYELCFTVPESQRGMLDTAIAHTALKPVCIGQITGPTAKLQLLLDGKPWPMPLQTGFNHFNEPPSQAED